MSFDSKPLGKSIVVSAPSGAGKTTLVKKLMQEIPELSFSISACSRLPRENEIEGQDYYFVGLSAFKDAIANNDFIEWEEVYKDHYYGTLKREVTRLWQANKVIIFDVDVVGGLNLKSLFKDSALSLFVKPPSLDVLESRLRSRKTESEDRIQVRIKKATWELEQAEQFDCIILNDDLSLATAQAVEQVKAFISK